MSCGMNAIVFSRNFNRLRRTNFRNMVPQINLPVLPRIGCQSIYTSSSLLEKYYKESHEWVNVEGSLGTCGISKHAADALGDIVYAQLPQPGDQVTGGEECGVLESVKAASEIYAPVSGKVVEKNDVVEDGPALINQSPGNEGWMYRLELSSLGELDNLMTEEQYNMFLESTNTDN